MKSTLLILFLQGLAVLSFLAAFPSEAEFITPWILYFVFSSLVMIYAEIIHERELRELELD